MKEFRHHYREFLKFFSLPTFFFLTVVGNSFLVIACIVVYFLEIDHNPMMDSFLDALWWGVTTITTVGYGDVVPLSTPSRIIGIILMYSGTVLFVGFTSLFAAYWIRLAMEKEIIPLEKEVKKEEKETHRIEKDIAEINKKLDDLLKNRS